MNDFTKIFQQPNENLKEEPLKQSEGMKKFLDQIPRAKTWPPDCNNCEVVAQLKAENAALKAERDEARREVCRLVELDSNVPITPEESAIEHDWDCFKDGK